MIAVIQGAADVLHHRIGTCAHDCGMIPTIETIQNAAERSADLTKQLFAYGRQGTDELHPIVINSSINAALELVRRTIGSQISLETNLHDQALVVNGDDSAIQNALVNLCINARDAMPHGGTISITSEIGQFPPSHTKARPMLPAYTSSSKIVVTASPKNIIDHIFDPFFTTKELGGGTGLGLAAVYGTIHQHHGIIQVYSEADEGAAFHIYLPITNGTQVNATRRHTPTEKLNTISGSILIADDEEMLREVIQSGLEGFGARSLLAPDGKHAVDIVSKHPQEISCVLLDVVMPGQDVYETVSQIRQHAPNIPIVLMSGFSAQRLEGQLSELPFIRKPFDFKKLSGLIVQTIRQP